MTEADWLNCVSPTLMLDFLRSKVSDRKRNLFAAGCFRRIWPLLVLEETRMAVEVLELHADGKATAEALAASKEKAMAAILAWAEVTNTEGNTTATERAAVAITFESAYDMVVGAAEATAWVKVGTPEAVSEPEEQAQCDLLRDIFGNTFRPVHIDPAWLAWNDGTVVKLAQGIYDERAFDRLPILADALEEARCPDPDILAHCRQPGEHVRGCWVVDSILGKE